MNEQELDAFMETIPNPVGNASVFHVHIVRTDHIAIMTDTNVNGIVVHFGISRPEAERQAREILFQVKENWERLARQYGLSRNEIETMRPAFRECYQ